jgi:hypothetical protein
MTFDDIYLKASNGNYTGVTCSQSDLNRSVEFDISDSDSSGYLSIVESCGKYHIVLVDEATGKVSYRTDSSENFEEVRNKLVMHLNCAVVKINRVISMIEGVL